MEILIGNLRVATKWELFGLINNIAKIQFINNLYNNLANVFHKNPLYASKSYFSSLQNAKNSPPIFIHFFLPCSHSKL